MATQAETRFNDYVVKDISLADFGRKEITLAEFQQRPWWHHVIESGASLLSRLL